MFCPPLVQAQIVADSQAPRQQQATILNAANGVPLVNIQTPSAAGISRNTYSQFDVSQQGAVLNNSRTNAQTQLGGWVQGNPWLATGSAKVILNQVNSASPSQLRGYVEVAGQRAEVIIANPAGLHLDGSGFINASKVTLSTGTPLWQGGNLDSYRVAGGVVSIGGAGLDMSQTDQAAILSRAIQINAGVWAQNLLLQTGLNDIHADSGQQQALRPDKAGSPPAYALDVAALGGMYAGKITLIGTEAGLGVRNAGTLASSAGDLLLQADGQLLNSGRLASQQNITLQAAGLDNSGSSYALNQQRIVLAGVASNSGLLAAGQNLDMAASSVVQGAGATMAAGLQQDGSLSGSGQLSVSAQQAISHNGGKQLAAGTMLQQAQRLDLANSQLQANSMQLQASAGDINLQGANVQAAATFAASSPQTLYTRSATLEAGQLALSVHDLDNQQGQIRQTGLADVAISVPGNIDNRQGTLRSNAANLALSTAQLDTTSGAVLHAGSGRLAIQADRLQAAQATLGSNGHLDIRSIDATLPGAQVFASQLTISTGSLDISQAQLTNTAASTMQLTATGTLSASQATLLGQGSLVLQAAQLDSHAGNVQSVGGQQVAVSGQWDNQAGTWLSAGDSQLAAGALLNDQGRLAANTLQLQVNGALSNQQGHITAQQQASLQSAALDNHQGLIGSRQDLTIQTGTLLNTGGRLEAAGTAALRTQAIDNRQGTMVAGSIQLDSLGQLLDNRQGTLQATGSLQVHSGELDNRAGQIAAGSQLSLDAADKPLRNGGTLGQGGISSQGTLALAAGTLDNQAGYVASISALDISAKQGVNNQGGQLLTLGQASLQADSLDNRSGQLQAGGAANITLSADVLNTAGLLRSNSSLAMRAATLDNQGTQGRDQGVEANSLQLTLATLDNRQGSVRANQVLTLATTAGLDNRAGLLASAGSLAIDSQQALQNHAGEIAAGQNLALNTPGLDGTGIVRSAGDMAVTLLADALHTGDMHAGGQLQLAVHGQLENQGIVEAGQLLHLQADSLINAQPGSIKASQLQADITGDIDNRGLMDGGLATLHAARLNNLGTGRLYGDQIQLDTKQLLNAEENGQAAVIATRDSLDIATTQLENREHALLFSAGDLRIGGQLDSRGQASGAAADIRNASASIEALGNMVLAADTVHNLNQHFSLTTETLPEEHITEYQGSGAATRYLPGSEGVYIYNDESDYLHTPEGNYEQWLAYQYTRTTVVPKIASSDPGKIQAAGHVTVQARQLDNVQSEILAGQTLTTQVSVLNNPEAPGTRTVSDSGSVTSYWRNRKKGRDNTGSSTSGYQPPAIETQQPLSPSIIQSQQAVSVGTAPGALSLAPVDSHTPGAGSVSGSPRAAGSIAPITEVPAVQAPGGQPLASVIRSTLPPLAWPASSLFHSAPATTSHYLIETDPRFASYRQWLSSDYMLSALGSDPATAQKRLGDGFYEQKLIRDQVAQLTGRRFLTGYASDEAQYRALMDSGVTFAQTYGLRPGIALSTEQIARLTSDIVWLVAQTVTLPDGSQQSALVPQVYVRARPGDLTAGGSLLSADTLQLSVSNTLNNSGTLAGRQLVSIQAGTLDSIGGRIRGEAVSLTARNDINLTGAEVRAGSSLAINAGRDLNITSTTASSNNAQGSRTVVDRVAGLYVEGGAGQLLASAGRKLTLTAANLQNEATGGLTQLQAGQNLTLATVQTGSSNQLQWQGNNARSDSQRQDVGSSIASAGDITLKAGGNVHSTAANLGSQAGAISLQAAGNVQLDAGQSRVQVDESHQYSGSNGALSRKTTTTRDTLDQTQAIGSQLSGQTVTLNADKDINVIGSSIASDQATTLKATGNVTLAAAQNSSSESHSRDEKKSGLMSSGGLGFTVGKVQQGNANTVTTTQAVGSTVGSLQGDVVIQAGQAYRQTGSSVLTPQGDIDVQAQSLTIQEARQQTRVDSSSYSKQSGLTVGLGGGALDMAQNTLQSGKAAASAGNQRNQALNALMTYAAGTDLIEQGKAVSQAAERNGVMGSDGQPGAAAASGIKVSVSVGSSQSRSHSLSNSDTAAASMLKAGGDIRLNATQADLTVQGSSVQAAQVLALKAAQAINLTASASNESNRSSNSSSAASLGVSVGIGEGSAGLSADVAASRGKGQSNADSTTYNNSHISAGQQLTLDSGSDTTVRGATISAPQVVANVGRNLNVESLQDTATSQATQRSTGITASVPLVGSGGNASINLAKQNSDSQYRSVFEQSGIQAGDGGFHITVQGNTDLKGAVIASQADASRNTLQTGTLTTSHISNSMSASASSSGLSVGTGMLDGKYAASKAIAGNLLNQGGASQSDNSTTHSAISAAQINVAGKTTDSSQATLLDSQGQTVSTDTADAHRALAKPDVAALEQQAQQKQADNMLLFKTAVAFTDGAFKKMFLTEAKMYTLARGEDGSVLKDEQGKPQFRELTNEEKANLKPGPDGKVHIANNGIFNGGELDPSAAAKYADQNNGATYFIHFPEANNIVSELLIAAYQKHLEGDVFGLTNATQEVKNAMQQYGQSGLQLDGHSRGTMTVGNAMTSLTKEPAAQGTLNKTTVNFYGPAYNVRQADELLAWLQNRDSMSPEEKNKAMLMFQNHDADPVGSWPVVGNNAGTGGSIPDGSNILLEQIKAVTGQENTVHNCYGAGSKDGACVNFWKDTGGKPVSLPARPDLLNEGVVK
jgi:filamentous hemagglutinin